MSLPLLPYSSYSKTLGKEAFHKPQHFDYLNGTAMMVVSEKPRIGGEPLPGQEFRSTRSGIPSVGGGPLWITFDKQVLCFDAYFQEAVAENRVESMRVRQCKIYFYLEDNTIQVVEPEFKNSGIPQGTLIHRHRIPLPPPKDDQFYSVHHFNINQEIVLYSRTFMVTDCDAFTCNFLRKLGVRLNPPAPTPEDKYSSLRRQMEASMQPLRPYERQDTLRQFLEHDRKVLHFFCLWDDSGTVFGDCRELTLHYFLSDDTIEIREIFCPNSGRDTVPKFLKRSKLPKAPTPKLQPGEVTNRTVLNVFGPVGQGGRFILDSLKTGAIQEDFYKDCDLALGAVINVWGRKVLLCDCDSFTKEFYRSKYGIEDFTPVPYKPRPTPKPTRQVPPYNGFGSEEDSLSSCQGLLPKPPKKDFRKFMEKDRQGLVSNVLRFAGKMVSEDPIDRERLFIISFYLSDDTISVFEPPQRNSGVIGGKFLERRRVKKPDQELLKSEASESYVGARDLYVGARLCLHQYEFQLVDVDEFTLNYMEDHAMEFPRANIGTIVSKLKSISEDKRREIERLLAVSDPEDTGVVSYGPLRDLLLEAGCQLSEHEILTLGRCYRVPAPASSHSDLNSALGAAQETLRKKHFEDFPEMTSAFLHEDRHRAGRLSTQEVRTICKAFRLPLPDDLLMTVVGRYEDETGGIDYHAFVSGLNWRENPAPPALADDSVKANVVWDSQTVAPPVKSINYSALLEDVFGQRE
ncbi:EF-hand domain-containing family member C2 isoform X2 [Brienomyrus brachyistius]|uniref:EF-hand domain-containing family member C2 isoform X2 n=1 Tax=Brienomyrus brachyistius TaxID=42636 RepID=UPI0020B457E3|nr:EF-hand domain-containing family member C2 isoform X2 [Brienomyrus brachyistius]